MKQQSSFFRRKFLMLANISPLRKGCQFQNCQKFQISKQLPNSHLRIIQKKQLWNLIILAIRWRKVVVLSNPQERILKSGKNSATLIKVLSTGQRKVFYQGQIYSFIIIGFQDIDQLIQALATQFDISLNLQQKTQNKFKEFQTLMKGTQFTKFSRSNCKKTNQRNIYYCPFLDSICWKPTSSKFPKISQTIQVVNIIAIHTNVQKQRMKYKSLKKTFTLQTNMDPECFLALEAKNGVKLELLSKNRETRNLYAKVLNNLIEDRMKNSQIEENCILTKYCQDLNQLKKNIFTTKEYYGITIEKLKNAFLSTTQTMFQQEKLKTRNIRKQSMKIIQQNKNNLEELLRENQGLDVSNWKLQQQLKLAQDQINFLKTSAAQTQESMYSNTITKLMQSIHSILGLNGDQSIENESCIGRNDQSEESRLIDCITSLEKIRVLYENSQNTEMGLRQDCQTYFDDILILKEENKKYKEINDELQYELDQAKNQMDLKEQQFEKVIQDMKEMQSVFQKLIVKKSNTLEVDNLKNENIKLKQLLSERLQDFKKQK